MERSASVSDTQQSSPLVKSMTHSQESRVSSSQDILRLSEENFSSVSALVNKLNSCTSAGTESNDDEKSGKVSATSNQEEKSMEATFPWIRSFGDLCRTSVGNKSIKILENLLTVYLQHVSIDVKSCYMKPNRAAKLKKCMNEALLFFHMFYQDVREPMEHSFYLSKMTDLMSMYLDMEIIASRRKKETTKKVVSRLTSSLYIFLDHSEHHMLDAILKAKLITKANQEICSPVLGKLMGSLRLVPLYELLYVRCVLVFKLWKKLLKDAEEKKRITVLALKKLTVPKNFLDKSKLLVDVLPRIPKTKKNITMFFMQAKFNLKIACKAFLKICKESESFGDKSLFYGEHLEDPPTIGEKADDVGAGRNTNLFNNIWSSISVVTDSSELNALTANKGKTDVLTGKKEKKKAKNKSKEAKKLTGRPEEKNKKKKKVKKKLVSDDSISVLDSVSTENALSVKEVKKKKKKLPLNGGNGKTAPSSVSDEQLVVVIKTEKNVQDTLAEVAKEVEGQRVNQVNEINSVGCLNEVVTEELKDDDDDEIRPPSVAVPVVVETSRALEIPESLEQVNQVNSMSSESLGVDTVAVEKSDSIAGSVCESIAVSVSESIAVSVPESVAASVPESIAASVSESIAVSIPESIAVSDPESVAVSISESIAASVSESVAVSVPETAEVDVTGSVTNEPERSITPAPCDSEVLTSVANVNRAICESVIVASSSSTSLVDCLVNTSHKSQPTAIIENEAVPSVISGENTSSTDVVPSKIVQPYLVTSQTCDDNEVTNIVSPREVIPPDSSIQLEDPVRVESCVRTVNSVVIQEEGFSGVDDSYFNRIYSTEYDSDDEILSDLRQQSTITGGEQDLSMPRNERDLIPRDSVPGNIFATENTEVLFEALAEDSMLPTHMDINSRALCSEDVQVDDSYTCGGDEGTELESPPMEPINENEKHSFECIMSNLRSTKDTGSFTQFGTERRDWSRTSSENNLLCSSCDYMLCGTNQSQCTSIVPAHKNILSTTSFMDEDDDERIISTDEEAECAYEYNSSSSSSSPQAKVSGGKVGSRSFATLYNEKDTLNSSSSTSDSPPSLKSVYMQNENPYRNVNSGISSFGSRDSSNRPRVGEKIPAPFLVGTSAHISQLTTTVTTTSTVSGIPALSTLKTVNVNLSNCLDPSVVNKQKKTSRTSKHSSATNSGGYRDTSVSSSQNRYPDVVRDAHEATEKEKSSTTRACPQKSSRSTVPLESGNNVSGKSVNCSVEALYRNVPDMGTRCIPPSIPPYPPIPAPTVVGKMHTGYCTCSVCYYAYLSMLNYNARGADAYGVPVQYNNSQTRTDMEIQKSQNAELLKKIEASLAEFDRSKSNSNSVNEKEIESKYKPNLDISLPPKKRLKSLPPVEEPKVKNGFVNMTKSSQAESFPSYPSRPMISIAELQLDKATINKLQQGSKSVRPPVSCMPKYPQYNTPQSYYSSLMPQESRDMYMKRIYGEQYQHFQRYPIVQSTMPKDPSMYKLVGSSLSYNPIMNGMPGLNTENSSVDIKPVINNGLVSSYSQSIPIGYPNNYPINKNSVDPSLKTPGQLKEVVPTTREYSVLKAELSKSSMPALIPIVPPPEFQFKVPAPKQPYVNMKQDMMNIPTLASNAMEVNGKQNVLDLSKQSSKENKSRGTRRKRNSNTSQPKPRNSKRSKRQTVIQNSEIGKSDGIFENGLSSTGISR